MPLGPDLFNALEPIDVMVWIEPLKPGPIDDQRVITLRLKVVGRRSVVATGKVDRYSPEWSIFQALGALFMELEAHESLPTRDQLREMLAKNLLRHVEPF